MTSELQAALIDATLALTAALLLVLALRVPLRRWLGARVAYAAWCLPPMAQLASVLPAPRKVVDIQWMAPLASVGPMTSDAVATVAGSDPSGWLVITWIAGALALMLTLMLRQWRFASGLRPLLPHGERSFLSARVSGPLLVGHWRPFIVLPLDFDRRYTPEQQALMLAHERAHLGGGDAATSAVAAILTCLAWFNPLAWWALRMFHFDQELACDARVLESRPQSRRSYADAMLQTQLAEQHARAPLGCHWPAGHPLKERIQMLTQALPGPARRRGGLLLIAVMSLLISLGVWAAQPERVVASGTGDRYFNVRMLLTRPGQPPLMPRLIVREGELSGIRSDDVELDLKVTGGSDDMAWIASTVRIGGKSVGSPTIAIKTGMPGSISIGAEQHPDFAVTFWVREHKGDPNSPAGDGEGATLADIRTPPRYPAEALRNGIEGEVMLEFDVDATGVVREVIVVSSTPPGMFDDAAVAAARGWWMNPANHPPGTFPGRQRAPIRFELDPEMVPAG